MRQATPGEPRPEELVWALKAKDATLLEEYIEEISGRTLTRPQRNIIRALAISDKRR
jgi:hypothetical protein